MSTTNTDFLPNTTGLNLGSPDQRWDGFFGDIVVNGTINGVPTADTVLVVSTSQALVFSTAINLFVIATGGVAGIALSLPSAVNYPGQVIKIKKADSGIGAVSVVPLSGTIDGFATYDLTNQYQYVNVEAGNGAWQVVGNN